MLMGDSLVTVVAVSGIVWWVVVAFSEDPTTVHHHSQDFSIDD